MENKDNIILLDPNKIIKKKIRRLTYKKRLKKKMKKKIFYNFKILAALIFLIISIFILIISLINVLGKKESNKKYQKLDLEKIHDVLNISLKYDEFNENVNKQYIQLQNYFCEKKEENLNQEYENKIQLKNINFNGKTFNMFVYKENDLVSKSIINSNNYEGSDSLKVLKALQYYANKNKLENKDIYVLDVGSNVGWYTFFLGKYGYKIISFEANKINNYILYKNYCLNQDVRATLITKGLDFEEKKCYLKVVKKNQGDGITFCDNLGKLNTTFNGETFNNIELTKLSKYIKFLTKNNLALIKIDVEGAEGNAILGGKELISKYHVPFIFMEYSKKYLKAHGTNVLEFLQFFENSGYKISRSDFFSKKYVSSSELINKENIFNLFFSHEKILENFKNI